MPISPSRRARLPGPPGQRIGVRIEAARLGGAVGQRQRGTRRRIHLVLVMRLDDLDVELRAATPARAMRTSSCATATPMRGVRRDQHRDVARRRRDARFELGAVPGRADDDGHARRAAHVERAQRQFGPREIDRHLRAARDPAAVRRRTRTPSALTPASSPTSRPSGLAAGRCNRGDDLERATAPRTRARWPCPCVRWRRSTLLSSHVLPVTLRATVCRSARESCETAAP